TQLAFIVLGLFGWSSFVYIIFNKRKKTLVSIPLLTQIGLYLTALAPLGLLVGLYIEMRMKEVNGIKKSKYNIKARKNAILIIIVSIASSLLALNNLR
ncbi:MAG: hypothetical protein OSB51_09965, partial [Dokdonia donghaensis]|nr:hypothetical protein [Dokdonia donghaensis]